MLDVTRVAGKFWIHCGRCCKEWLGLRICSRYGGVNGGDDADDANDADDDDYVEDDDDDDEYNKNNNNNNNG